MNLLRWLLCLSILPALPFAADAQARRDAIVVFKDGFHVKGVVNESVREVIWDRASGRPFPIFSGNFFLNDHVREILFSPAQVMKVQPTEFKPPTKIVRFDKVFQPRTIHATWEFTSFGKWTEQGERHIKLKAPKGPIELTQRIGTITPNYIIGATKDYEWNLLYFTDEFGPELTRKIALQIMSEVKPYKDWEIERKLFTVAKLMQEAGWLKEAEQELQNLIEAYPVTAKEAQERLDAIKKDRADLFVDGLEQASNVGQHKVAIAGLDGYDREELAKIVSSRQKLAATDLRAKYDKLKTDMAEMNRYLREMVSHTKSRAVWSKAAAFIADELNHDTANRLDEFLVSAKQFERERKNNQPLSLSAEKVLAIAISGWLQGNQAALPDEDAALKLAAARESVLEYVKAEGNRNAAISSLKRGALPVDVIARLVRMIPPADAAPAEALNTKVQTFECDGGSYLLQLPPDYHHLRSYSVLMLLQSGRDKADDMLPRFSEEAARHGFILVAPLWAGKAVLSSRYQGAVKEQSFVMDCLRDVRRRFNVDSDRAFLFGWEDGGNLAFDVALGHPDQFAGVVPMNGGLLPFTRRFYFPNAQYLPFYIVGGERDGHSVQMRDLFKKEWTRDPYACMYVEYKGRASEWYGVEIPKMMSWMSRKKRYMPTKALDGEFRSTRAINNRFYWLRTDSFTANSQFDQREKTWPQSFKPASFHATLTVGNKAEKGQAKIWNQLIVRTHGMRNVTFLITPEMKMDLKHPLAVTINGQQQVNMRKIEPSIETLLDELVLSGDRQRLVLAKVDLRP